MDESALTGESIPVEKNVGDTVISATINKQGSFRFKASKVGDDTTLAQIIRLVEEASSSKAPIAKLADKVSGIFVPVVIAIALLATVIWLILGYSFSFALSIGCLLYTSVSSFDALGLSENEQFWQVSLADLLRFYHDRGKRGAQCHSR